MIEMEEIKQVTLAGPTSAMADAIFGILCECVRIHEREGASPRWEELRKVAKSMRVQAFGTDGGDPVVPGDE